jgi:predicted amino acid dehydrogenase
MGLGAILPGLTKFGQTIKQEGLITTTGHGGTVHLLARTVENAKQQFHTNADGIGIIGAAGSIGQASLALLREQIPDQPIVTYDVRRKHLQDVLKNPGYSARVTVADSLIEAMKTTSVIVTAVTSQIDLDKEDPHGELDLAGKVIVDDSQPGSFSRTQVEQRGGKLVWVVGTDTSLDRSLTRSSDWNFGRETGLASRADVWGCEAEASVIGASGRYDHALRERVRPDTARAIGQLLDSHGVRVSKPQSYGRIVPVS